MQQEEETKKRIEEGEVIHLDFCRPMLGYKCIKQSDRLPP